MRFWLLKRRGAGLYDGYNAFIIRARSETDARRLADRFGSGSYRGIWINTRMADCVEIHRQGRAEVILVDGDVGLMDLGV
jgi:hypothetical protein